MEVNFIYAVGSHEWGELQECGDSNLKASFIALIYSSQEEGQEIAYNVEMKIIILDPATKLQTSEERRDKVSSLDKAAKFIERVNELTNPTRKVDIFKFNSNKDFPPFISWALDRAEKLQSILEN